jgi:hypothetical protein
MGDRCSTCDRPLATSEFYDAHRTGERETGCSCEECAALCWDELLCGGDGSCWEKRIDWRARALAAESELSAERSMFMSDRVEAEVETRTIERVAAWLRSKTRHSDWDWEDDAQLNELVYWLADQLLSGAWRKT